MAPLSWLRARPAPIRLTSPVRPPIPCRTSPKAPRYPSTTPTVRARSAESSASGRPASPVAHLAYVGLHALQHRGQESAGIAVTDGARPRAPQAPRAGRLACSTRRRSPASRAVTTRRGRRVAAIGHTRYSTTGSNTLPNVQPVYAQTDRGELMLGHNGNLTNARWLRDELTEQGVEFASASDTEVLAKLIAHAPGRDWAQRVEHAFHRAVGAYTFTMLTADALVAARDPVGFRPLALGRLPGGGWAVASESAALDAMGAQFVRDVDAGEVLTIDADGRPLVPLDARHARDASGCACSSSSTSRAPTASSTAASSTRRASRWAVASRASTRPMPTSSSPCRTPPSRPPSATPRRPASRTARASSSRATSGARSSSPPRRAARRRCA